ncbi:MAG TPA: GNAT family N-acetyltransferase [Casimicrobiaceae bacterium]|nr:GNAT family N-acetyltransferase [Casimicrobiaceae bacterium]
MHAVTLQDVTIRPLLREDLGAVVAIDAESEGVTRRAYFERRLVAALNTPKLHAQFAATDGQGLMGYILARVFTGEFGRIAPALRLEVVGVRRDARGQHVGASLFDALCDYARRHGIAEVRTTAAWNHHGILRWLDVMGFTLAPNHVVDCAVDGGGYARQRDEAPGSAEGEESAHEVNYGAPAGGDFERLARDIADVRAMDPADLGAIVRIDRSITGRDRSDYMQQKLVEAIHGSAIRVSLIARLEDMIVGFVMARVDLGDFGRTDPVAVLDTIGVDAQYAHRGVGHALLSQLFVNLGALRVERVETSVAPGDLALLGFLYDVGFGPSQRLAFVRRLA